MCEIVLAFSKANLPNSTALKLRSSGGAKRRRLGGEGGVLAERGREDGLQAGKGACSWPPRQGCTEAPEAAEARLREVLSRLPFLTCSST